MTLSTTDKEKALTTTGKPDALAQGGEWTPEQITLIKRTIAKGASDDELKLFMIQCQRTSLDPFTRQIYAIKRGGTMTIQVSIDGFRLIAERSGKYAGQIGPQWCGKDGEWRDVWLEPTPPVAAKVAVLRHDFSEPRWAVALWKEYSQPNGPMWKKMPALMLAKCAEALALRQAFPNDLSGLYTSDEMGQADNAPPPPRVDAATLPSDAEGELLPPSSDPGSPLPQERPPTSEGEGADQRTDEQKTTMFELARELWPSHKDDMDALKGKIKGVIKNMGFGSGGRASLTSGEAAFVISRLESSLKDLGEPKEKPDAEEPEPQEEAPPPPAEPPPTNEADDRPRGRITDQQRKHIFALAREFSGAKTDKDLFMKDLKTLIFNLVLKPPGEKVKPDPDISFSIKDLTVEQASIIIEKFKGYGDADRAFGLGGTSGSEQEPPEGGVGPPPADATEQAGEASSRSSGPEQASSPEPSNRDPEPPNGGDGEETAEQPTSPTGSPAPPDPKKDALLEWLADALSGKIADVAQGSANILCKAFLSTYGYATLSGASAEELEQFKEGVETKARPVPPSNPSKSTKGSNQGDSPKAEEDLF